MNVFAIPLVTLAAVAAGAARLRHGRPDRAGGDARTIRRVRFKLSCGVDGYEIENEDDDDAPMVFRRDWFEAHGFRPDKLVAVRVNGKSMEPRLYDGDLVIVNTAQNEPKDGEPFALNYEGVAVIKRLIRDGGEWWIRSDNPDKVRYPDKRTYDGVVVIGQVVYRQTSVV